VFVCQVVKLTQPLRGNANAMSEKKFRKSLGREKR
jgi:hypothetical protein